MSQILARTESRRPSYVLRLILRPWRFDLVMYFPSVLEVHKVVSARHTFPMMSIHILERLDLRMSVTTGAYIIYAYLYTAAVAIERGQLYG